MFYSLWFCIVLRGGRNDPHASHRQRDDRDTDDLCLSGDRI